MTPSDLPLDDLLDYLRLQLTAIKEDSDFKTHYLRAIDDYASHKNLDELPLFPQLVRYPVSVEEFMFGASYLNRPRPEIYPEVLEELIKINNPNGYRISNPYTEGVFTGGIGSAKSTTAIYTEVYQTYVLSCFRDPHGTFGLDSSSEIRVIFQSLTGAHAEDGDYARFRAIIDQSTYFQTVFPYDPRSKKVLKFPNRIEVRPITSDGGAIGSNVIGGLIEEMNFMAVVQKSKKSIDRGEYNQAATIYNGISRRRKTRFIQGGKMPGILCLVSSKRYPGEFTDKKLEEAKRDPTIYVYDKRVWDIKPKGTFSPSTFSVFIGDLTRKARILAPGEHVATADLDLVRKIPEDFRSEFEDDIIGSLRDIAGVGTVARYPYMLAADKVLAGFGHHPNAFGAQETDFVDPPLTIDFSHIQHKDYPRWVHIDLAKNGDACGLCIGHVPGFQTMEHKEGGVVTQETMPIIRIDGLLRIKAPRNGEILFSKVRDILYHFNNQGVYIKWVTFDTFQSVDSIQILRSKGFSTGTKSVDTDNTPYELTKSAFYEGRLQLPAHERCSQEMLGLEKDLKTGKLDHPPQGSKDVSDAVAGVVYGLTMRREIWGMFSIPIQTLLERTQEIQESNDHVQKVKEQTQDPQSGI